MPAKNTRVIRPAVLAADRASHAALGGISSYKPANLAYDKPALEALQTDMDTKIAAAAQADAEAKAKRDDAVMSTWAYHDGVVGMRDSIGVQFGKNSNEFQSVGRKKTTEYKKPTRKTTETKSTKSSS